MLSSGLQSFIVLNYYVASAAKYGMETSIWLLYAEVPWISVVEEVFIVVVHAAKDGAIVCTA